MKLKKENLLKGLEERKNYSEKLVNILEELGDKIYKTIPEELELYEENDQGFYFYTGCFDFGIYGIGVTRSGLKLIKEINNYNKEKTFLSVSDLKNNQLIFLANNVKKYIETVNNLIKEDNEKLLECLNIFK